MKKNIIRFKWIVALILAFATFTSCLKDKGWEDGSYGAVRDTEGGMYLTIRKAGLGNVANSGVIINTLSPEYDTVEIDVDLDFAQPTSQELVVKIAIDDAKRLEYNSKFSKNFQPVTTDMVKLASTTLKIPAGSRSVKTTIAIKQDKFDPAKSYMFPISIMEAPQNSLSGNLNTRYFNIIGNPLAGPTLHDFTRWNNADGSGPPNSLSYVNEPRVILPISETVFSIESGYYIEPRYEVSFKNSNGVYSDFSVVLNKDDVASMKAAGVEIYSAPKVIKADPVNKEYIFQYTVLSGGTAYRYIQDRYHQ